MSSSEESRVGRCLLHNWVEERATELMDSTVPKSHINRNGHRGLLTVDMASKAHGVSTVKAAFTTPTGPGVRQKGLRAELLEKRLVRMIRKTRGNRGKTLMEQIQAELNPELPAPEMRSTTRADYTAGGFRSVCGGPSKGHDYKTDQAITFWSENHQRIQGVTQVRTGDTPFKKNATFSTPITERMEEPVDLTQQN